MKKLISAASALAMAASMVGSAVPFVTGAADASKGFELRPFLNKDGSAASLTISEADIAAGDVSVPIGVYYVESTNDTEGILAQWTISSTDGDASNDYVHFSKYAGNTKYFSTNIEFETTSGKVNTNKIIGFAGTVSVDEEDGSVSFRQPNDKSVYSVADNYMTTGCPNAWGSIAWAGSSKGDAYKWTGSASDTYPVTVFTVNFAKGTPAGTYTIDFVDKPIDEYNNSSCLVETADKGNKYMVSNGNLTLKGIEIKIGEGKAPTTTEAKPLVTTEQAPVTTATPPTTTTPGGTPSTGDYPPQPSQDGKKADFVITGGEVSLKPGESKNVEFTVQSGDHKVVLIQAKTDLSLAGTDKGLSYEVNTSSRIRCADEEYGEKFYEYLDEDGNEVSASMKDDETSKAIPLIDGNSICRVKVTADANATPGKYLYGFKTYHVVENAFPPVQEFDAVVNYAKIEVLGEGVPPTTTAAPVTTATPATTATPVTTAQPPVTTDVPNPGDTRYGDVNCDGKVNIADVVLLNKWLNDAKSYPEMSTQGKINADACDPKNGEGIDMNDSKAIIMSIVHLVTLPTTPDKL